MNANGNQADQASGGDLRARRRSLGLSQEEVARSADCSTGYIRLLERGFAPGHSDVLPRVIAALNDVALGGQSEREVTTAAGGAAGDACSG